MSSSNKEEKKPCCSKKENISLGNGENKGACCSGLQSLASQSSTQSNTDSSPEPSSLLMAASPCCSREKTIAKPVEGSKSWNIRYFALTIFFVILWYLAYSRIPTVASWLTFDIFAIESSSRLGLAVQFFLYDTVKILLLMVGLIYLIAWVRASLNTERIRDYLVGKRRGVGYFLGSMFGAVTPFCSCSSIPLFLGFTSARIPIGISMSFLITSPLINEIAVVLLWGLLGWKFAIMYVVVGMLAGMLGGLLMDTIKAERLLQPFILEKAKNTPILQSINGVQAKLTVRARHNFASDETKSILKRVWMWVFIGVGIGAALHGYVPDAWFAENFGAGQWWSVPAAVFVGIPLYTNVTGIVPIMESLLMKGLPIGTTLAFCMSSVAASIPEFLLLRQIMTAKLQAIFVVYLWTTFVLVGWFFNILDSWNILSLGI